MNREYLSETRRETIRGGSTPASMRVTVLDRYSRFMPLTVNGIAMSLNIKCTATVNGNNLTGDVVGIPD
jgi:hypothetical protein